MDIIIYNPLSKNGGSEKEALKLVKKLNRKKIPNQLISLLTIKDINDFIMKNQDAERIIIVGGDGTLNHLANNLTLTDFPQQLLLLRGGTGNDFARSIKNKEKLIDIKKHLKDLPIIKFNDQKRFFLNGVGLGLDGLVVYKVSNSKFKNTKFNYFRHAYESFREYNYDLATITIDGETREVAKTWLVSIMNSAYFGGGMKIAPKANRENNDLQVIIIKKLNKFKLFLLFPLIYLGLHTKITKYVEVVKASEVKLTFDKSKYMQIDGESYQDIKEIFVIK